MLAWHLAELQVDPESSRVLQVTVTAAHHFASHDGRLVVPAAGEGIVAVGPPGRVDCEELVLDVYGDGIAIGLGATPAARHVRMGDVVFGVAEDGELAEILLTRMSPKEVARARECLAEESAQGVWAPPSAWGRSSGRQVAMRLRRAWSFAGGASLRGGCFSLARAVGDDIRPPQAANGWLSPSQSH